MRATPVGWTLHAAGRDARGRRAWDGFLLRLAELVGVDSLPLWLLAPIFVAGAVVIRVAGIQSSKATDVLDAKLHLGPALGGLIVLAVATNLPEIAITVSAAISGNIEVAAGNILGGIAVQTVVLVVLLFFGPTATALNRSPTALHP